MTRQATTGGTGYTENSDWLTTMMNAVVVVDNGTELVSHFAAAADVGVDEDVRKWWVDQDEDADNDSDTGAAAAAADVLPHPAAVCDVCQLMKQLFVEI